MDQTQPSRRRSARRPTGRRALVVAAVALLTALAGCASFGVFTDLAEVLEGAGYTDVDVSFDGRNPDTVVVRASSPVGDTVAEAHATAAELVWTRFPRRFAAVRVTIDGERQVHTRAALQERFGPRPAALDETELAEDLTRYSLVTVIGVVVAGLVVVAGSGTVVLLLMRARRRVAPGSGPWGAPPGPRPWMPTADAPDAAVLPPLPRPDAAPAPAPARSGPPPVGRRPRGPVPPPSQTPPGWER